MQPLAHRRLAPGRRLGPTSSPWTPCLLLLLGRLGGARAWSSLAETQCPAGRVWTGAATPNIAYALAPGACAHLASQFRDDRIFTWDALTCVTVRSEVREAFDAWERALSGAVRFVESDHFESADVQMGVERLPLSEERIAYARWTIPLCAQLGGASTASAVARRLLVRYDQESCWYADRAFCAKIRDRATGVRVGLLTAWLVVVGITASLTLRPLSGYDTPARVAAWTGVIGFPLAYWGVLEPCVHCHDFRATTMHEIGHLVGLGHTDVPGASRYCGCGAAATSCLFLEAAEEVADAPIMMRDSLHRAASCLTDDDIRGGRTLVGLPCNATDAHTCYAHDGGYAGYARCVTAAALAFAVAWSVVAARHCYRWCRGRVRTPPEPKPPVERGSLRVMQRA